MSSSATRETAPPAAATSVARAVNLRRDVPARSVDLMLVARSTRVVVIAGPRPDQQRARHRDDDAEQQRSLVDLECRMDDHVSRILDLAEQLDAELTRRQCRRRLRQSRAPGSQSAAAESGVRGSRRWPASGPSRAREPARGSRADRRRSRRRHTARQSTACQRTTTAAASNGRCSTVNSSSVCAMSASLSFVFGYARSRSRRDRLELGARIATSSHRTATCP